MTARTLRSIVLCMAAALSVPAYAQITITAADVGAQIAAGHALSTHSDTLVGTANIGAPGATSWDFSGLASHTTLTLTSVAPGATPFAGSFTGETHSFSTVTTLQGITGTVYEYLTLGTSLLDLGNMAQAPVAPGITAELHTTNVPADVFYQLPFTLNTTWTSNFTSTQVIALNGVPISNIATTHNATYLVDAYGPLTIPGGGTYNALRIKKTDSVTVKSVTYQIIAANGATVNLSATDPNGPTSGTIAINSASWSGPISTGVSTLPGLPEGFALLANYPNPFNPSTTIRYEIAAAERVRIAVSDLLGREVAVLMDGDQPAGRYEVTWDAKGMASGVYYCRMEAGNFRSTRTMLLMR